MLQYLPHPDRDAWAACLAASPQRLPYAEAWWLDVVTGGRWSAVVEPDGAGGYASVLPVPWRRRWRGVGPRVAYQPLLTQQLGLFTTARSRETAVTAYLAQLPAGLPAYGHLNTTNALPTPPPGFRVGERLTYLLDLSPAYPALAAAYHTNHRRNLKRAADLTLAITTDGHAAGALLTLFRAHKGRELADVRPRHYRMLHTLLNTAAARGQLLLITATAPTGELLAGGAFLRDDRQLIYLLGAVGEAGRQCGASHAVIDALLRHEAGTGRVLDFEGSMIESIARFYAGFGARPAPYLTFERQ